MRQKRIYLGAFAALLLATSTHAGTVTELASGAVHEVTPGGAECVSNAFHDPDGPGLLCPIRARASCEAGGEADLSVVSCATARAAEGGAHAHYQFWFRIEPADAAATTPTFVPIHILAPGVIWDLKLTNGALSEQAGAASATAFLRLRSDPVDDLSSRGTTVAQTPILLASHGGVGGCLSIPTGVDDVANLLISCELAKSQIQQGKASPSVAAVVEVGRTYSVELTMDLQVKKRVTVKPSTLEVSGRLDPNDPPGPLGGNVLKWSKLVISVGTATDDLQAQIDALRAELGQLRTDFQLHSHTYLTGRGVGHNNVETDTGLPSFPQIGPAAAGDWDGDGLADAADVCPTSPWGAPVDLDGCTAAEFCAQHAAPRACRRADWLSDEGRRPKDCAWRGGSCVAR